MELVQITLRYLNINRGPYHVVKVPYQTPVLYISEAIFRKINYPTQNEAQMLYFGEWTQCKLQKTRTVLVLTLKNLKFLPHLP